MKKPKKVDVLIAGAGPVGLLAALNLAQRGHNVEIVDAQPHASIHSYALALHPSTLSLLEEQGVLEKILEGSRKVEQIHFHQDQAVAGTVDYAASGFAHPYVAVVGQDRLEGILEEALEEHGVRVKWHHRLSSVHDDGEKVHVGIDELEERVLGYAVAHWDGFVRRNHEVDARMVVGADGFNSIVRWNLEVPFPEVGSPEDFAVFEFSTHCGACDAMRVIEKDDLVSVRWPIADRGCRWSFQLDENGIPLGNDRRKSSDMVQLVDGMPFQSLDADLLHELLHARAPWCPAAADNNYWQISVRFEKRLVGRFGRGRVWLAGDAGHLASPVGVHSVNVGLREALDLTNHMDGVLNGSKSIESLEEYHEARLAEWRFLFGLTGELDPGAHADPFFVRNRKRLLSWLPAGGSDLAVLAKQLGVSVHGMPVSMKRVPAVSG